MNVYDFDKTIFYPDSSATFLKYLLKKYPRIFCLELTEIFSAFFRFVVGGFQDSNQLKESCFSVIRYLDDPEREAEEFWNTHMDHIGQWYLRQMKSDDLVISASPEFLLRPVSKKLGFRLIATPMSISTGKICGLNNRGQVKLKNYMEQFPDQTIEEFYSDSHADEPLARLANKAFMVSKGEVSPWRFI